MKKFLFLMLFVIANMMLFSCSSDSDNTPPAKTEHYYVKYTVTGSSWNRSPMGHYSAPTSTTITFQDKTGKTTTSQSGSIKFTKVVGPVDANFKPSLSASGRNDGTYYASYEGTIEILEDGVKLEGSNSAAGEGHISLGCEINH